jgi:hypothetical protein
MTRTAVRVEVRGITVGHLPREDAAVLHGYLAAAHERGQYAQCEGRIVVASNGDYSIYLHLANLDSVAFALRPRGGEATMDDPSQTDVSGRAGHQRVGITNTGSCSFSAAELEDARRAYQANYNYRTMTVAAGVLKLQPSWVRADSRTHCARQQPLPGHGVISSTATSLHWWCEIRASRQPLRY